MNDKISFIGLGKLGSALVEKLLESNLSLTVYNRTFEKTRPLVALGAMAAETIQQTVQEADIVFSNVLDDDALKAVSRDIIDHATKPLIHISTSTILPKTAVELETMHANRNLQFISAPILGTPAMVRANHAMSICSGSKSAFDKVKSYIEPYANKTDYVGGHVTNAYVLKICMNYTLITAIELTGELFAFCEKSHMDTTYIQQALKQIYGHPGVHYYIDKIHQRDYDDVNFDLKGGNKDVHLFQDAFLDAGVSPDLAAAIQGKFTQALSNNKRDKDWSAICDVIRERSGIPS